MKPPPPWMIRKRENGRWSIWEWSTRFGRYVVFENTTTGAEAIALFAAGWLT